ncbi:MAG: hypothetical protein HPY53_03680 [Brevinematales bacterium]|nr:hypothetical protein [Brevinematales bacterium]
MKKKGVFIGTFVILFFGGCTLFKELLEPSDISKILDNQHKDNIPPLIAINSPENGQEVGAIYQVTGIVQDDNSGVKKVTLLLDGSTIPVSLIGETWTANISNTSYGIHTNTVIAEDNAGNVSDPKSVWINRVNIPSVVISSPANGSMVTNPNIILSGSTLIDLPNVVTSVQVQLNSGSWNTATGTEFWTNNLLLIEGTNTIYARAISDNGKTNTSAVWKVIKATYPSIGVSYPADNFSTNIPTITVSGTASVLNPFQISMIQVRSNGGAWMTASGTFSWSMPFTLVEGTNAIYARAISDSDLTNSTVSSLKVIKYSFPSISITSHANQSTTVVPLILLSGSSSVPLPYHITQVQVQLNSGVWSNTSGTTSWSIELSLQNGTNTINTMAITDNGKTNYGTIWKIICTTAYRYTRQIGGAIMDQASSINIDPAGNIYLSGSFGSTVNFAADWGQSESKTSGGDQDLFITKINADGTYGWTKKAGGNLAESGNSLAFDSAGNVYVTGFYYSSSVNFAADWGGSDIKTNASSAWDIFVMKISNNGSYCWTKRLGGTGQDTANSITVSPSGDIFITGNYYYTVNFAGDWSSTDSKTNAGSSDVFITKISADGSYGWTKRLGGSGIDKAEEITADPWENIYITGYTRSSLGVNFAADWGGTDSRSPQLYDIFITKISNNGDYSWTKLIGQGASEFAYSIAADSLGNVYFTGSFPETYTINFAQDWGGSDNKFSSGGNDVFITKINANGTYGWTKIIGGSGNDQGNFITTDDSDNVYVTGSFESNVNFAADWTGYIGTDIKVSAGNSDMFITKINADGTYGITQRVGGSQLDSGFALAVDTSGATYVFGVFQTNVNFSDDWGGADDKTSAGTGDMFLTKFK